MLRVFLLASDPRNPKKIYSNHLDPNVTSNRFEFRNPNENTTEERPISEEREEERAHEIQQCLTMIIKIRRMRGEFVKTSFSRGRLECKEHETGAALGEGGGGTGWKRKEASANISGTQRVTRIKKEIALRVFSLELLGRNK